MMRRRAIITCLEVRRRRGRSGRALQQSAMPVMGFYAVPARLEPNADRLLRFRQGLREAGFVEGKDVAVEYRWADGRQ